MPTSIPSPRLGSRHPKPGHREITKPSSKEGRGLSFNGETKVGGNLALQIAATDEGGSKKGLAKSQLYEICAANCWKAPLFECFKEEGASHTKMFSFKVIVEIEEASTKVLECFGGPQAKKKTAAEHAAEGVLWYLKHVGYSAKGD